RNEQRIPPLPKTRVLEVRISPPLPYSKGSSRKTGAFLLFDVELFNWQSSGFPDLPKIARVGSSNLSTPATFKALAEMLELFLL
ncbi:hypothetical protein, partial [Vibrio neptunius]